MSLCVNVFVYDFEFSSDAFPVIKDPQITEAIISQRDTYHGFAPMLDYVVGELLPAVLSAEVASKPGAKYLEF